ncbi:DNA polymerase III subunit delta [Alkaliphilus oremlandii]|uniref:DNA polymerase III subunit delta n=1 Tax=Alkaliphilus oremlandii (strain OhILAs) TaxID=350688 RepID=A8MFA1_ALKOO|nr:DNA polymerase III subunit delta [Alkaliphilus oremlandii]ABW18770.1 DNA polymerase III, delta subunit [Alkaliphilus oremlandii OhILAs]
MNYKEFVDSIKKKEIKNVYLFAGEEVFLIDDALERLKSTVLNAGFQELNFTILDGKEVSIHQITDACETLPFMAERKLVYLKNMDVFQSKSKSISEEQEQYIIDYIKKIPDTTTLVFWGNTTVDSRKKIVKEINKYGHFVECSKLTEDELGKWIKKMFKAYGKIIEAKEISFIKGNLDYLGKTSTQTLLDVENELKKIISFMGQASEVTTEHIEKILTSNFQNNIFKLLDSIEGRNSSDSIKRLNYILEDGEPILKILATLGNQIKNILFSKVLLEEGYTSKMIATKLNIHPFVASKCAAQSRRFTVERLKELLNKCLETDKMIKVGKMNDKIAIELLVLEMSK